MEWHSLAVFVLSVCGVVTLHAAGNMLSDWADYRSGVDNAEAYAVPNLVFGLFQPEEYLRMSIVLFAAGCLCGIAVVLLGSPSVLIIGVVGVLLTILYSYLKYHALGDLNIFLIYGILIILGTTAAACGNIVWESLILSVPIGVITVSVLHANNTNDIDSDRAAGIKTFAMLIGGRASSILYRFYMLFPFAWIMLCVILGWIHPFSLLSLIALVPAWKNFVQASGFKENGIEAMKGLDQSTAKLQFAFSGLLSIGLILAGLL